MKRRRSDNDSELASKALKRCFHAELCPWRVSCDVLAKSNKFQTCGDGKSAICARLTRILNSSRNGQPSKKAERTSRVKHVRERGALSFAGIVCNSERTSAAVLHLDRSIALAMPIGDALFETSTKVWCDNRSIDKDEWREDVESFATSGTAFDITFSSQDLPFSLRFCHKSIELFKPAFCPTKEVKLGFDVVAAEHNAFPALRQQLYSRSMKSAPQHFKWKPAYPGDNRHLSIHLTSKKY